MLLWDRMAGRYSAEVIGLVAERMWWNSMLFAVRLSDQTRDPWWKRERAKVEGAQKQRIGSGKVRCGA